MITWTGYKKTTHMEEYLTTEDISIKCSLLLKSISVIFRVSGTQTPKEEGLNQPPTREGWTESPHEIYEVAILRLEDHGLSQKV